MEQSKMRKCLLPWIQNVKHQFNWSILSMNVNAIDLLEENREQINWPYLSLNPDLFD